MICPVCVWINYLAISGSYIMQHSHSVQGVPVWTPAVILHIEALELEAVEILHCGKYSSLLNEMLLYLYMIACVMSKPATSISNEKDHYRAYGIHNY